MNLNYTEFAMVVIGMILILVMAYLMKTYGVAQ
jgi:hypothetical protein